MKSLLSLAIIFSVFVGSLAAPTLDPEGPLVEAATLEPDVKSRAENATIEAKLEDATVEPKAKVENVTLEPESKDRLLENATIVPEAKVFRRESLRFRRSGADIRAFHQRQRAVKRHKNYDPTWPSEPIVTSIEIGQSEQVFFVSQDSGIDTAFVLDVSYPTLVYGQSAYDPANASGIDRGFYQSHSGDFGVYGEAYTDLVAFFGPVNQTFGSIDAVTTVNYVYDPAFTVDGVFGLAWDPSKKDDPVTPDSAPILNVFAPYPEIPRFFVQYLGGYDGQWAASITNFGSELDSICGSPLASAALSYDQASSSLSFQVDSTALGNQTAPGDAAKLDSGLPTIVLPYEAYIIVLQTLNSDYDYDLGLFTTACSNTDVYDDFVIVINGAELRVPASNYIADIQLNDGRCALAFDYTSEFTTAYAFGIPLQLSYCVKHDIDNSQISFLEVIAQESTTVAV